MTAPIKIAVFVSSHGFGHAARISAVMDSLLRLNERLVYEIFSEVPRWFFQEALPPASFNYHVTKTDVGLIQKSPLKEDLEATLKSLQDFLPYEPKLVADLAKQLKPMDCKLVLCDIAPLGIAVAKAAMIPALLIENFTWDWIYEGYATHSIHFAPFIAYFKDLFQRVDFHIQAEPVCQIRSGAFKVNPISRNNKQNKITIRRKLKAPGFGKVVLVTLGGVPTRHDYLAELKKYKEIFFILPIDVPAQSWDENCVILPHHSDFYHPDLVRASDAVIGKLGYSTLAEIYHAGIPFGYITRDQFRESSALAEFVNKKMPSIEISQREFEKGIWLDKISDLLRIKAVNREEVNGAEQAAQIVNTILSDRR